MKKVVLLLLGVFLTSSAMVAPASTPTAGRDLQLCKTAAGKPMTKCSQLPLPTGPYTKGLDKGGFCKPSTDPWTYDKALNTCVLTRSCLFNAGHKPGGYKDMTLQLGGDEAYGALTIPCKQKSKHGCLFVKIEVWGVKNWLRCP